MRPELRWLVMTVLIVGVLLGISALALDRPDVVWTADGPHCPACREAVAMQAAKCKTCGTDFDWSIAPDERSPISQHSLSRLESESLRAEVERLGEERALQIVATNLKLPEADAKAWLLAVARGRCGHCGGTGEELGLSEDEERDCSVCFGLRNCIASGGDGYMTWGSAGAARDLERFHAEVQALSPKLSEAVRAEELEKLARAFIADHAGTVEASRLPYWRHLVELRGANSASAAGVSRRRLDVVLGALRAAQAE